MEYNINWQIDIQTFPILLVHLLNRQPTGIYIEHTHTLVAQTVKNLPVM